MLIEVQVIQRTVWRCKSECWSVVTFTLSTFYVSHTYIHNSHPPPPHTHTLQEAESGATAGNRVVSEGLAGLTITSEYLLC